MRPKIPNDFHVTPFSVLFYTASTTTTSTLSLHDALPISNSRSLDSPKERARWTGLTSFRLGNRRTRRQPDLSVPRFSRPFPWDVGNLQRQSTVLQFRRDMGIELRPGSYCRVRGVGASQTLCSRSREHRRYRLCHLRRESRQ